MMFRMCHHADVSVTKMWGKMVGGGGGEQVGENQGLNILKFILPKELKANFFDVVILFSVTCHQISVVQKF